MQMDESFREVSNYWYTLKGIVTGDKRAACFCDKVQEVVMNDKELESRLLVKQIKCFYFLTRYRNLLIAVLKAKLVAQGIPFPGANRIHIYNEGPVTPEIIRDILELLLDIGNGVPDRDLPCLPVIQEKEFNIVAI